MSRVVPLPAVNTVVDNTVIVLNADGTVANAGGVVSSIYADQQVVTASAAALSVLIAIKLLRQKPSLTNWLGIAATSAALAIIAVI